MENIGLTILSGLFITIVGGVIVAILTNKISITHKTLTISHTTKECVSKYKSGQFTFDYSNNNGAYQIGSGDKTFTTKWSKASDTSIHSYSDSTDIDSIALITDNIEINNIDYIDCDFSSRVRSPRINETVVWKNKNGYYAATKVVSIKDRTRRDNIDQITCQYVIF